MSNSEPVPSHRKPVACVWVGPICGAVLYDIEMTSSTSGGKTNTLCGPPAEPGAAPPPEEGVAGASQRETSQSEVARSQSEPGLPPEPPPPPPPASNSAWSQSVLGSS